MFHTPALRRLAPVALLAASLALLFAGVALVLFLQQRQQQGTIEALGQQLDLEPWDRGWIRLYETTAIEVFDAAQVKRTAARIAELIVVIWPMCQELRKGDAKIRLAVRE